MPYKDKEKQNQASREAMVRYRSRKCGVIPVIPSKDKAVVIPIPKRVLTIEERKVKLSEIILHPIETPVTAGHVIAASDQLNQLDAAYPPERHAVLGEIRIRLLPVERTRQEAES